MVWRARWFRRQEGGSGPVTLVTIPAVWPNPEGDTQKSLVPYRPHAPSGASLHGRVFEIELKPLVVLVRPPAAVKTADTRAPSGRPSGASPERQHV
jgi:hypothetical protein